MRWRSCVVAAPGPSLTPEVAEQCRGQNVIVVQDAYKLIPWADVLYGCEENWWNISGPKDFAGQKWSSHDPDMNEKRKCAERHGLKLINGIDQDNFSMTHGLIHYGGNSGFQAINLALVEFHVEHITLIGFDMRRVDNKTHFFGEHPSGLNHPDFAHFIPMFNRAAKALPSHIRVVNATPGSALTCFPMMTLEAALGEIGQVPALRDVRSA